MPIRAHHLPAYLPQGVFFVMVLATWLAYLPGLQGTFLFDDFVNLDALGKYGAVDNWPAFWRYLTAGVADPTGRPLSMLSFLLDARNWPAEPYPFKRTNLILHIVNGFLLFTLLWRWGSLARVRSQTAGLVAALGAGLWLLHPLHVSTTMYIVQREAMLPATFVLLGLHGYTAGYGIAAREGRLGTWLAFGSVVLCTVLGVLSKANAAILPALTWLVDRLILAPVLPMSPNAAHSMRRLRFVALLLPTAILALYLTNGVWDALRHGTAAYRPWTMSERLLTENRVFFSYLKHLLLPTPYSGGLYNDAFPVSHGLFAPPTTALSTLAILVLGAAAITWRRRLGSWSVAFLFFLVAHVMETWSLQLEIYYEHRNYVPSLLLFWPLAQWLLRPLENPRGIAHNLRGIRLTLAILFPMLLAMFTFMRASVWGDPLLQARLWSQINSGSPRAQAYAAQVELQHGNVESAIGRLQPLLDRKPDEIQLALNLVGAKCRAGGIEDTDINAAVTALRTAKVLQRMGYEWFQTAIPAAASDPCHGLTLDQIERLIDAARENPRARTIAGLRQDLDSVAGTLAIARREPDSAAQYFNSAFDNQPRMGVALAQAAALAQAGYFRQALRHLDHAKHNVPTQDIYAIRDMGALHRWILWKQGYWEAETSALELAIRTDLMHQSSTQTNEN